jgi:hypothetical protein
MHALFVLGDLRAKLVKQFQSRFVYITEQTPKAFTSPRSTPEQPWWSMTNNT